MKQKSEVGSQKSEVRRPVRSLPSPTDIWLERINTGLLLMRVQRELVRRGGILALLLALFTVHCSLPTAVAQSNNNYHPIYLRRGPDASRATNALASGEPGWTTDAHKLWIGDGATPGGIGVAMDSDLTAAVSNLTSALTVWVDEQGYITGVTSNMVETALGYSPAPASITNGLASIVWVNSQGFITGVTTNMIGAALGYLPPPASVTNGLASLAYVNNLMNTVADYINGNFYRIGSNFVFAGPGVSVAQSNGWYYISATGGISADTVTNIAQIVAATVAQSVFNTNYLNSLQVAQTLTIASNVTLGNMSVFAPTNLSPWPVQISGIITNGSVVTGYPGRWFPPFSFDQVVAIHWLTNGLVAQTGTGLTFAIDVNATNGTPLQMSVQLTNNFGSGISLSPVMTVTNAGAPGGGLPWHIVPGPWGMDNGSIESGGYADGDQVALTVPNSTEQAVFQILMSGGTYTGVSLVSGGSYSVYPGDAGSCTVTAVTGSGSGGSFSWAAGAWAQ